jgi:FkbM family methyltransferase
LSPLPIPPFYRSARRLAGRAKRRLFPSPEMAAWQRACRAAERVPRHAPGTIELMGYRLRYADLLTLCPQWHDLFVAGAYRFVAAGQVPRVLDAGANIGLASLYFKRLYPRARITAYEADPAICALLRENLAANGAADVETVQAAVWTRTGSLDFRCEGSDSGAVVDPGSGLGADLPGPVRSVPAVRLRDVLEREPVDLLKLDIEGAEAAVLADCAGALGQVRALIAEVHEFDPARRRTPEILDRLAEAGFTCALDELHPLPWRSPVAAPGTPFPGRALCWVVLVRAWKGEA